MLKGLIIGLMVTLPLSVTTVAHADPCASFESVQAQLQKVVTERGDTYTDLTGDDAQRFLKILNAEPPVTEYKADHVGLIMSKNLPFAVVALATGSCGYDRMTRLPIEQFVRLYAQFRGEKT